MLTTATYEQKITRIIISAGGSLLVLLPSLAAGVALLEGDLPVQPALKMSCLIMFLASVNFGTVIMLDPYHRYFSKLSPPAIISMVAVVFLYLVIASLKLYFPPISYSWLAPFVVASEALIYTTIFLEKNIPLKCLLSLDSIALMFLWALGDADKFTLPF